MGPKNSKAGITLGRRGFQKASTFLLQQNPRAFLMMHYTF